jgi:hypothetical protein
MKTNQLSNRRVTKLSIIVVLAAATLTCALPARAIDPVPDYVNAIESTPNLLGYWRFTTASQADSEVNGYTGTFTGGAAVGAAKSGPGIFGDSANSAVSWTARPPCSPPA